MTHVNDMKAVKHVNNAKVIPYEMMGVHNMRYVGKSPLPQTFFGDPTKAALAHSSQWILNLGKELPSSNSSNIFSLIVDLESAS